MDKFKWIVVTLFLISLGANVYLFGRLRTVEDEQDELSVRWIEILDRIDTAEKKLDEKSSNLEDEILRLDLSKTDSSETDSIKSNTEATQYQSDKNKDDLEEIKDKLRIYN